MAYSAAEKGGGGGEKKKKKKKAGKPIGDHAPMIVNHVDSTYDLQFFGRYTHISAAAVSMVSITCIMKRNI